jgi:DNA polymerase-3 subunit chi
MTRVDFYLLGQGSDDRERIACRLTEKVQRLGHRVYVLAADPQSAREIDELLWTYSQGSFVPHALLQDGINAEEHPVLVGHDEPPPALSDVLLNLANDVPAWIGRFARVAELVGPGDDDKARGRERYRFYRERGYPLETHNL